MPILPSKQAGPVVGPAALSEMEVLQVPCGLAQGLSGLQGI